MSTPTIPEHYIDGIGKARFSGGVVRLDLCSSTAALDQKEPAVSATVTQRLILSSQGFLQAVSTLNTLLKQLVDAGVLTQHRKLEDTADDESSTVPQKVVADQTRNIA